MSTVNHVELRRRRTRLKEAPDASLWLGTNLCSCLPFPSPFYSNFPPSQFAVLPKDLGLRID